MIAAGMETSMIETQKGYACGAGMGKMMCNNVIYQILAGEDPKTYPLLGLASVEKGSYSSSGGACTIKDNGSEMTISNCDCSDPENYDFVDEGRFKI